MKLESLDSKIIHFFRKISLPFARVALFVVFFWFGLLKVVGLSPATGMVQELFEKTVQVMPFESFFFYFGIFEMVIGIMFMIKGFERVVIPLLFVHMITTLGPLVLLPEMTWLGFMAPSLEGQYIIKNLALIALAIVIAAHLHPAKNLREMV